MGARWSRGRSWVYSWWLESGIRREMGGGGTCPPAHDFKDLAEPGCWDSAGLWATAILVCMMLLLLVRHCRVLQHQRIGVHWGPRSAQESRNNPEISFQPQSFFKAPTPAYATCDPEARARIPQDREFQHLALKFLPSPY